MANKYLCVYQRNDQTNLYQEFIAESEQQVRLHCEQAQDIEHVLFVVAAHSAGPAIELQNSGFLDITQATCVLRREPVDRTFEA